MLSPTVTLKIAQNTWGSLWGGDCHLLNLTVRLFHLLFLSSHMQVYNYYFVFGSYCCGLSGNAVLENQRNGKTECIKKKEENYKINPKCYFTILLLFFSSFHQQAHFCQTSKRQNNW